MENESHSWVGTIICPCIVLDNILLSFFLSLSLSLSLSLHTHIYAHTCIDIPWLAQPYPALLVVVATLIPQTIHPHSLLLLLYWHSRCHHHHHCCCCCRHYYHRHPRHHCLVVCNKESTNPDSPTIPCRLPWGFGQSTSRCRDWIRTATPTSTPQRRCLPKRIGQRHESGVESYWLLLWQNCLSRSDCGWKRKEGLCSDPKRETTEWDENQDRGTQWRQRPRWYWWHEEDDPAKTHSAGTETKEQTSSRRKSDRGGTSRLFFRGYLLLRSSVVSRVRAESIRNLCLPSSFWNVECRISIVSTILSINVCHDDITPASKNVLCSNFDWSVSWRFLATSARHGVVCCEGKQERKRMEASPETCARPICEGYTPVGEKKKRKPKEDIRSQIINRPKM